MSMQTLKITGMMCDGCASNVKDALERDPGVTQADVELNTGTAQVTYDPQQTTPQYLVDTVRRSGYGAEPAA
jgi:copper chaperone CopZ